MGGAGCGRGLAVGGALRQAQHLCASCLTLPICNMRPAPLVPEDADGNFKELSLGECTW